MGGRERKARTVLWSSALGLLLPCESTRYMIVTVFLNACLWTSEEARFGRGTPALLPPSVLAPRTKNRSASPGCCSGTPDAVLRSYRPPKLVSTTECETSGGPPRALSKMSKGQQSFSTGLETPVEEDTFGNSCGNDLCLMFN